MRILAIETSTNRGTIALLDQRELVHEAILPAEQRTAQSLAPAMESSLEQARWTPSSIDLVAVTSGPGSFTGLRIAVTAAKTFAYAVGAQLIAINTLRVLVEQLPADICAACAIMDAQRRQLFAVRYRRAPDHGWEATEECHIVDRDSLGELLAPDTVLIGPVLERLGPAFLEKQPRALPEYWLPRASTVGRLAWLAHNAGQADDLFKLQPQYYRPSYAEEKKR